MGYPTIEYVLNHYNLLMCDHISVGLTEIRYELEGSVINFEISHGGNVDDNFVSVNKNLSKITSLSDTLKMLDGLPVLESKERVGPDYNWRKVWIYERNEEVEDIHYLFI